MKNHRFRAFVNGEMVYDIQNGCGLDGCHCSEGLPGWANLKDADVMQITGLLDQEDINGWDGDIVDYEDPFYRFTERLVLKYDESEGAIVPTRLDGSRARVSLRRALESGRIVGNRHEQPELLKEVK